MLLFTNKAVTGVGSSEVRPLSYVTPLSHFRTSNACNNENLCKKQKSSKSLIFFRSENISFSYISLVKKSVLEICVFILSIFFYMSLRARCPSIFSSIAIELNLPRDD